MNVYRESKGTDRHGGVDGDSDGVGGAEYK